MIVDKNYCMSSFLRYRVVANNQYAWADNVIPKKFSYEGLQSIPVKTSDEIDLVIKEILKKDLDENTGIMLSGGMDSAILATYMPEGSKAYTMRCVADGALDEVEYAKRFADINKLDLHIVDITWDDVNRVNPILMKGCNSPFHSIQPLIYRVCEEAKKDGLTKLVCGETADLHFGGLDGLLSKDWILEEFIERYTYLEPSKVLKNPINITDVFMPFVNEEGVVDVHKFLNKHFVFESAMKDYINPSSLSDIKLIMPYAKMRLDAPLDLERVRRGENKYLIRELFAKRYNGLEPNKKLPMPRAVGIWLKDWGGVKRGEFKKFDINELKPDQKWLVYILETFLNMLDN